MANTSMREIYQKAQDLGMALAQSAAYERVQNAQAAIELSGVAGACVELYKAAQEKLGDLMAEPDATQEQIRQATQDVEAAERALRENSEVAELLTAQMEFQSMMKQINNLIGFYVGAEDQSSGCTGSCETCAGCH